jgi:hypothetical protein
MPETYKGYTVNQQGDIPPWGSQYNTTTKQLIDSSLESVESKYIDYGYGYIKPNQQSVLLANVNCDFLGIDPNNDSPDISGNYPVVLFPSNDNAQFGAFSTTTNHNVVLSSYGSYTEIAFKVIDIARHTITIGLTFPTYTYSTTGQTLADNPAGVGIFYGQDENTTGINLYYKNTWDAVPPTLIAENVAPKLVNGDEIILTTNSPTGSAAIDLTLKRFNGDVLHTISLDSSYLEPVDTINLNTFVSIVKHSVDGLPTLGGKHVKVAIQA